MRVEDAPEPGIIPEPRGDPQHGRTRPYADRFEQPPDERTVPAASTTDGPASPIDEVIEPPGARDQRLGQPPGHERE